MRDPVLMAVLTAMLTGVASVAGAAFAKRLFRLVRGAIKLWREFRAFREWRADGGGSGPATGPGPES